MRLRNCMEEASVNKGFQKVPLRLVMVYVKSILSGQERSLSANETIKPIFSVLYSSCFTWCVIWQKHSYWQASVRLIWVVEWVLWANFASLVLESWVCLGTDVFSGMCFSGGSKWLKCLRDAVFHDETEHPGWWTQHSAFQMWANAFNRVVKLVLKTRQTQSTESYLESSLFPLSLCTSIAFLCRLKPTYWERQRESNHNSTGKRGM